MTEDSLKLKGLCSVVPLVSIGMPVFNGEEFLAESLASLLAQTYRDFELIVSDNGSTDQTVAIVEAFAKHDDRIRLVKQESNIGAVGNFNFLIFESHGKYFKWAAADDLCEPTFLEECVSKLESDESAAWCHTDSDKIDSNGDSLLHQVKSNPEVVYENGKPIGWEAPPRKHFNSDSPAKRFSGVVLGTNWCVDSYGMFRMSLLRKTRLLPKIYGAEKILIAELSMYGTYCHVPKLLFSQRIHDAASSAIKSSDKQSDYVGQKMRYSTRLTILWAHIWSIVRSNISMQAKAKCLIAVLRYVFQISKWKRVIGSMITGRGVGGGGARTLEST